jgi:hypothetical protein
MSLENVSRHTPPPRRHEAASSSVRPEGKRGAGFRGYLVPSSEIPMLGQMLEHDVMLCKRVCIFFF